MIEHVRQPDNMTRNLITPERPHQHLANYPLVMLTGIMRYIFNYLLFLSIFLLSYTLYAQEVIVTEIDDYIEGKQEYTFGFAPGDKISYSIESIKGFTDEMQIIEYPATTRYKSAKVPDLYKGTFDLPKGGFLTLRMIKLSTGKSRVKIRISRIPASPVYADFKTAVTWETVFDTIWKGGKPELPVADTIFSYKSVRKVALVDTQLITIVDRYEHVPAGSPGSPAATTVNVKLPVNEKTEQYTKELLQWAYVIGVGEASERAWDDARVSFSSDISDMSASAYASDPMAALATGVASAISLQPPSGPAVQYQVAYKNNLGETHIIDNGRSTLAYGDATFPRQGGFSVILKNDQLRELDVHLSITAAEVRTSYITETVKVPKQIIRKATIVSTYRLLERKVPHHVE